MVFRAMVTAPAKASPNGSILVVGGGITGMTVAIEAADCGMDAHIVERSPSLGGRVAQLSTYFPKMCPPSCGLEINYRRLRSHDRIHVHTQSEVKRVEGSAGSFDVTIEHIPRFVRSNCTACGSCAAKCPAHRSDPHNLGMSTTKAISLPFDMAYPHRFFIDRTACENPTCTACASECPVSAIDLAEQPTTEILNVVAIVVATGWQPYDAVKLTNLGFGTHPDIITNLMMERYASPQGPTHGKIVCPSNGRAPPSVAFIQCAGSRDDTHLPYCSGVCCAVALKQVQAVRTALPDARIHVLYIDIRTMGRWEDLYTKARGSPNVTMVRGKVARITVVENMPMLHVEDTLTSTIENISADLVVLATGMVPSTRNEPLPFEMLVDEFGYGINQLDRTGVIFAGCARRPFSVSESVRDASGAVLRAIQCQQARST